MTSRRRAAAMLCLCFFLTASCKRSTKPRIAVVPKGQSHLFWQSIHAGAVKAGNELGVEILWNGPPLETDYSRQIGIVEDFINQRVDGIVLAPSNGESMVPVVERAAQEQIPVTIFDSGIKTDKYVSYVSTDNYKGGVIAAERMGELLPQGGKIVVVATMPGSVSTIERENGFRETIEKKFPRIQIVAMQYGMAEHAKSLAVAEDMMTANPTIAAMFCSNESGTVGGVQAAKSKGIAGKLKIVGFDSSPTLIEDIKAGTLDSLVVQNPFKMGYLSVRTLVDQIHGKTPEKRIDTGATLVSAANLTQPAIQELLNPPLSTYLK
jgi:ribose transport system substrate-binding protein